MLLPIEAGNFSQLSVAHDGKLLFVRGQSANSRVATGIKIFDLGDEKREEKLVTDAGGYSLSADGKKLAVRRGRSISVMNAAAGGGESTTAVTTGLRTTIQPREEWNQIFSDAWRVMRDYFYEPTMHGVDWKAVGEHYRAMLPDVTTREDLTWILAEMISELNIGHAYIGGAGDVEDTSSVPVGLLGADFELVEAEGVRAYRISRIYEGAPWDTDARGPLSQHGLDVEVGDYVLAVNGVPVDVSKDPWAAFLGTADRATVITVSKKPVIDAEARDVVVTPVRSEGDLRYRAWVEARRAYVAEKSGGQIGYIYVPNTGVDGQDELFRQFMGQRFMQGLIIDDRWNGGGQIPTRFIELLNRPVTNYWARRHGTDWVWPTDAAPGHKAMLINGLAGSGGDMFPWLFRENKLGPLIGTRTWGGLVGISGNPAFVDGGSITVPTFGFYERDGTWGVEGHGVDPDIEVIDDPALMVDGPLDGFKDPQLDRAIEEVRKAIEAKPWVRPARPTSPDRSGMGIPKSDW